MTDLDKSKYQAVERYIAEVSKQFATGKATEHSYRPALASLVGTFAQVCGDERTSAHRLRCPRLHHLQGRRIEDSGGFC